ncbi:MAG: TauD/TfdA family dioxygenase [Pseudomonadota bacterium]
MADIAKTLTVTPSGQSCGARITGIDISQLLSDAVISGLRKAWLEHHVLAFPNQKLDHEQFQRFALCFGKFGEDPFFNPIPGQTHIAAVRREADDTSPIFAEFWHSDWSFLQQPPAGTMLYSIEIPPMGGDTYFSNQHLSYEAMPADLKQKCDRLTAIHSAEIGYAPGTGVYATKERMGSMDIKPSDDAYKRERHPLVPVHPETGRKGLLSGLSYWAGFEDAEDGTVLSDEEARELGLQLNQWQSREEFLYVHKWEPDMLLLWDNRSTIHRATGGYEGHRRELHRITIY